MSKNNNSLRTPYSKRKMRTYFQLAMITIAFAVVFAVFYACQASKTTKLDLENVKLIQYDKPAEDTPVVVFETSLGTFKAVLYPNEAPKYCEYFTNLVNDGYYNNTYVFAVQDEVFFMGGSKTVNGVDDSNTNTDTIEQELSANLWPFTGALISYGDKGGSAFNKKVLAGSRLMFVRSIEFTDEIKEQLDSAGGNKDLVETFKNKGGVPNFSQQYTIFGQVYDGYDVYDKICSYDVKDEKTIQPSDEITFKKVYMSTYKENPNDDFFTNSNSQNDSVDSISSSNLDSSSENS